MHEKRSSLSHREELWLCTWTIKVLRKTLIAMWQTLWFLAVAALASVWAGCVELIAGQFQNQGQKIYLRQVFLQNLRGHKVVFRGNDSSRHGWLRSSKYSTPWWIFDKDRKVGVSCGWFSSSSAKKETELKLGRSLLLCGIFALCSSELSAIEQFLHLFFGNWFLIVSYGH